MLVGNKCDLREEREVTVEEGTAAATKFGLSFLETSAIEATNVDESFKQVLEEIYKLNSSTNPSGTIGEESNDPHGESIKLDAPAAASKSSKNSKCC